MKRFITATLTLALFTGMSAGKASAQDVLGANYEGEGFVDLNSLNAGPVHGLNPGDNGFVYGAMCTNELIAIIAFAAKEVGFTCTYVCLRGEKVSIKDVHCPSVIAPSDCPELGGQEGENIVDLWFELVDAGYTEDEAFDLIELVIGDHNALGFEGESVNILTSYEGKLPIAEPLPVNNTQRGYISNIRSKKRTHWSEPQGHILW